jgi:hypothetical protein
MGVIQQDTFSNHTKFLLELLDPAVQCTMNFRNVHDYETVHTAERPRRPDSPMAALRITCRYSMKFSAMAEYKCLPLLSKLLWSCVCDEVFLKWSPLKFHQPLIC